jgi:NDP-sugar pyrophosphorylase family protein
MKAIILAAGEGTRLKPLTNTRPKPLIEIMGKSILEYNLECVYKDVDEIFIVVKYLKEKIIEKFGNNYKKVKITYIDQPKED